MTLLNWWNAIGRRDRIAVGAGALLLIAAVVTAGIWLLQPRFVPVFPGATRQDSAALVARMETLKADYRIDPQSGEVLVAEGDKERIRRELLEKGFPVKAAVGFEIFDNGDFGMTEFTERINYQRALEGELARTIMALDEVSFARVHVVLPQSSLFRAASDKPKASVLLIERQGSTLDAAQVAGIQRMVASAVAGLAPEAVSVHDHRGLDLAPGSGGGLSAASVSSDVAAKEVTESYLAAKVYDALSRIVDKNLVSVSVDVTLEDGHVTSTREEVLPAAQSAAAAVPRAGAAAVATSDISSHAAKIEAAPATAGRSAPAETERASQRLWEQSEHGPGQVKRISVAVLVPDPSASGISLDQIRELVAAAVGAEPDRGDRVAVYAFSGRTAASAVAAAPAALSPPAARAPIAAATISFWQWLVPFVIGLSVAGIGVLGLRAIAPARGGAAALSERERIELLEQVRQWLQAK